MALNFRKVKLQDAAMILKWRTDPEITRYLFTDIDPDVTAQENWIRRCETRADFFHFIIYVDDRPIGYLRFADYDSHNRRCSTGNYIYQSDDRRRYAGLLHTFIMDYAFFKLDCHKIVNSFMVGNDRVVKIQQVLKFTYVGLYRDHNFKHDHFYDVHVFELLRGEWETHRRLYSRAETKAAFEDWSNDENDHD